MGQLAETRRREAIVLAECFAGSAPLAAAVKALGVPVRPLLDAGGMTCDLRGPAQRLRESLTAAADRGCELVLVLEPPCATFSRARDRSCRTKLRSAALPEGIPPLGDRVIDANRLCEAAASIAEWAAAELGAWVMILCPASSYFWRMPCVRSLLDHGFIDTVFCPCMYGSAEKRPARVRCFPRVPPSLGRTCRWEPRLGRHACGAAEHAALRPGAADAATSLAGHPGVVEAWARDVAVWAQRGQVTGPRLPPQQAPDRHRRVAPHWTRATFTRTPREQKAMEDAACTAGLRNPAWLVEAPGAQLASALAPVRQALLAARAARGGLQGLAGACGLAPRRPLPSEEDVAFARLQVGRSLDLSWARADQHHASSPLRHNIFGAVLERLDDSDRVIADWLRDGAPMGVECPIPPGGHFPLVEQERELSPADLPDAYFYRGNHPSFEEFHGELAPPTYTLVKDYLAKGFGQRFKSREEAESVMGTVFPAPLGNVRKRRPDGTYKNRVIQDKRANAVNSCSVTHERTVLPRGVDHAVDLARAREFDDHVEVLILDFEDAFMAVPLHVQERKYDCAFIRNFDDRGDAFIVWSVLGFGGKSNPLVYSRIASAAARTGQAVCLPRHLRLQLYVDDPAITLCGSHGECTREADLLIAWWLVLGFRLSWRKGVHQPAEEGHVWIGIHYQLADHTAIMSLTESYCRTTVEALIPLCRRRGSVSLAAARSAVGKAARVAQVLPATMPFASALWAALADAQRSLPRPEQRQLCGSTALPVVRFFAAAGFFRALLTGEAVAGEGPLLPLVREVHAWPRELRLAPCPLHVEFDASPWGGGGVLLQGRAPLQYFAVAWDADLLKRFDASLGDPAWQSLWEFYTLLLCLLCWGRHATDQRLTLHGDNVGALQAALSLKGRGSMLAVARELSWRTIRFGWCFDTEHLPSEQNDLADPLSRLAAVPPAPFPQQLRNARAREVHPPPGPEIWLAWVPRAP